MAQASRIEWTDATWNPVAGCTPVSAGCRNCYAARMALRLEAMTGAVGAKYAGTARRTRSGRPVFTGQVALDHEALDVPRRWRSPRTVFVNSMSDLFHEFVPDGFIEAVFEVVADCERHIFQILTKRPERALRMSESLSWPSNLWMGTSVEDRHVIDRARVLQQIPARTRFLSCEPLIGPLGRMPLAGIHWVIVGGESGPGARPMDPEWVRSIRRQCDGKGVPFFFKQWGGVNKKAGGRELDGKEWNATPLTVSAGT